MMEFHENEDLESVVTRLESLLSEAIEKIGEKLKNDDLKEEAYKLLEENKRMQSEKTNKELILEHINKVKNFLKKVSDLEREADSKKDRDVEVLREDIGLIEQILEEEIPQSVPQIETAIKKEETVVAEEKLSIEMFLRELETIKEYLRVLSDKIFDLGDELIELKEKVMKLEQVVLGPKEKSLAPKTVTAQPEKKVEEEIVEEAEYGAREIEYLLKDALSVIGRKDENPIKRAIKLEALKILMENKVKELDDYPEELVNQFKKVYSLVTKETKMLREVLKEVLKV